MELLGKVLAPVAVSAKVGVEAWLTWWTRCRRLWPGGGPRWTGARRSLTPTSRTRARGRRRARARASRTADTARRPGPSRPSQVGGVTPLGAVWGAETGRSRPPPRLRASCPPASGVWPQVRGCRVPPPVWPLHCTPVHSDQFDELLLTAKPTPDPPHPDNPIHVYH